MKKKKIVNVNVVYIFYSHNLRKTFTQLVWGFFNFFFHSLAMWHQYHRSHFEHVYVHFMQQLFGWRFLSLVFVFFFLKNIASMYVWCIHCALFTFILFCFVFSIFFSSFFPFLFDFSVFSSSLKIEIEIETVWMLRTQSTIHTYINNRQISKPKQKKNNTYDENK